MRYSGKRNTIKIRRASLVATLISGLLLSSIPAPVFAGEGEGAGGGVGFSRDDYMSEEQLVQADKLYEQNAFRIRAGALRELIVKGDERTEDRRFYLGTSLLGKLFDGGRLSDLFARGDNE